ncbi:MAG: PD-(D/E)XK nuclease family protein [Myxococcota bacterium]|nr:PD-(D/E)XK nuclease family protein [Myxococcota bacterium]
MSELLFFLGRTRLDRERAIEALQVSVNALGQRSILHLVTNRRSLNNLQRPAQTRHQFFPHGQLLSDWLADCGREQLGSRGLLSQDLLGYQLGAMAREQDLLLDTSSSLSQHEIGLHLATAYRALQEQFSTPKGFPSAILKLFVDFDERLRHHNRWSSLEGAMREAALAEPWNPPHCPDTQAVLVDTPESLSPVRRTLLMRSIRGWLEQGRSVVITLPAQRALQGDDVFEFFDGSPQTTGQRGHSNDPACAVRRALFDTFLQHDIGRVIWCGSEIQEELHPATPRTSADQALATDVGGSSATPELEHAATHVHVFEAQSEWEEVMAIGVDLKQRLLNGDFEPGDAVVAVPELPRYAPLILSMAEDLGLPVDLSSAAHLVRHPTGSALAALQRLSQKQTKQEDYLDLVSASPIRQEFELPPEQLLAQLRAARVRRAWPKGWWSDLVEWNASQPNPVDLHATKLCVDRLIDIDNRLLLPIRRCTSPSDLIQRMVQALQGLGFPSGPQDPTGESAGAWKAALDLLLETEKLAHQLSDTEEAKEWLLQHLSRKIRQTTFRTSTPQPNAVRVLGALELRGQSASYIWFAGLARGAYPAPQSPHPLLPGSVWRTLQPVSPAAESRAQFQALLREALLGHHCLRLSWPQMRSGKSRVPAPALREYIDYFDGSQFNPIRAVPKDASFSKRAHLGHGLAVSPKAEPLLAHQRRRQEQRKEGLNSYDGLTEIHTPYSDGVAVTRLERYIACPARDWYSKILKLEDSGEREEDATPLTAGSLLHRVLEIFVERHGGAYLSDGQNYQLMAQRLHGVALEVLEDETIQPSLTRDGLEDLKEKWLPGLLDTDPKGVLASWLLQELSKLPERHPLEVEAKVEGLNIAGTPIRGRVDRVDAMGEDGCLIIDYKSGTTPDIADLQSGLVIQGLLYGEWARQKWHNRAHVASVYAKVGKADDIRERSWMGAESLLASVGKTSKVVLDAEARRRHLDHIETALQSLKSGVHHTTLAKPSKVGCERCAFHRICRFDEQRSKMLASASQAVGPMEVK